MSRSATSGLALCLAGLALLATPFAVKAGQACFVPADNAHLSFQVIQNAPAPDKRTLRQYAHFPLTGVASMQLGSVIKASPGIASYYFQWANRSNAVLTNADGEVIPRKANLQPSLAGKRKQRSMFTSVARANACTLAQTANVLGLSERARDFGAAGAIRLVSETELVDAQPLAPPDVCVIPKGRLPDGRSGVLLDYEVQNGRSPDDTTRFLEQWVQLVHGAHRQAILLVNPLDAPTQAYTGVTSANAHKLVNLFDLTTILLWSKNPAHSVAASYQAQKAIVSAGGPFDGSRILIDFELAGTSLDDARFVRHVIEADRLAGVFFWRNGAKQGGDCRSDVNAKIAVIALGHDSPRPQQRDREL